MKQQGFIGTYKSHALYQKVFYLQTFNICIVNKTCIMYRLDKILQYFYALFFLHYNHVYLYYLFKI